MSEPFISEITIFAGWFTPRGWAACNGNLVSAKQIGPLATLLGSTYGGDGVNTVGLPNLQGAAPMGSGQGPGLKHRRIGDTGGATEVTLTMAEMPSHEHGMLGGPRSALGLGDSTDPVGATFAGDTSLTSYHTENAALILANENILEKSGDDQPHNNMQPNMGMRYIIAIDGVYPTRG